jgi:hypothetical protein
MAVSGLGVDLTEIRSRVAFRLHGTRDFSKLNTQDADNVDSVIKSGLRRFYWPQMTDPSINHRWTFLKPEFTLKIDNARRDYLLDPKIGGVLGVLSYLAADQAYIPVPQVPVEEIQQLRSRNTQVNTFPTRYATRWVAADGLADQRLEIMFYPDPDDAYSLFLRARFRPDALTTDSSVPWGGPECAEAILQSCLAVAEQQIDGEAGVETAAFRAALSAAIQWDAANNVDQGEFMGMNEDGYYPAPFGTEIRGNFNERWYYQSFNAVTLGGGS